MTTTIEKLENVIDVLLQKYPNPKDNNGQAVNNEASMISTLKTLKDKLCKKDKLILDMKQTKHSKWSEFDQYPQSVFENHKQSLISTKEFELIMLQHQINFYMDLLEREMQGAYKRTET